MESKFTVETADNSNDLIVTEGFSAVGKIAIIGHGKNPINMQSISEIINKSLFEKFMKNVESIEEMHRDDVRILMSGNTKDIITAYAEEVHDDIEKYLPYILTIDSMCDNEVELEIQSENLFNNSLPNIILDDDKTVYGLEDDHHVRHCGKYTKKRKWKNKKKRRK